MKKIIFILALFMMLPAFAVDETNTIPDTKYSIVKINSDRTPVRLRPNEDAQRFSHLFKDTILYSTGEDKDYYRIELLGQEPFYINKKYADIENLVNEKILENLEGIAFKNKRKKHIVEFELSQKTAYSIKENNNGGLDFAIYDTLFEPIYVKINGSNPFFRISKESGENKININYIKEAPLFGYSVLNYDKGYKLVIKKTPKINRKKPLKGIRVVVDAGHGGSESGACAFGLKEKDINLQIAHILAHELKKRGAKVYMTRKEDKKVGLYDRVEFAQKHNADILLSIHQNALANPKNIYKKHGVGVYYYNKQALGLAQKLQKNLLETTGFKDDGINYASFALTRPTDQLSVLIECGYLIYKPEADKLIDENFQKNLAKSIVAGCEEYLKETFAKK